MTDPFIYLKKRTLVDWLTVICRIVDSTCSGSGSDGGVLASEMRG